MFTYYICMTDRIPSEKKFFSYSIVTGGNISVVVDICAVNGGSSYFTENLHMNLGQFTTNVGREKKLRY